MKNIMLVKINKRYVERKIYFKKMKTIVFLDLMTIYHRISRDLKKI